MYTKKNEILLCIRPIGIEYNSHIFRKTVSKLIYFYRMFWLKLIDKAFLFSVLNLCKFRSFVLKMKEKKICLNQSIWPQKQKKQKLLSKFTLGTFEYNFKAHLWNSIGKRGFVFRKCWGFFWKTTPKKRSIKNGKKNICIS